jgi:enoyl-CoA hydratase/carnithine racemase
MAKFESKPAESFGFREVLYDKRDWVATITINRPHNYNAYSTEALGELAAAFQDAAFDDSVGAVVYTGAGTRAFCTGGDVKEYEVEYTQRPRDYWKYMQRFRAYIESIVNCGKPVVARLNGMAVGGGNESQMACDLAVMAEHAWIGQVGTRVGSVAAGGATQWLPIMIGDRRAREMLMFNGQIPARQCLEWGLVNRVVPSVTKDGEFIEGASAEQIAKAHKEQDGYAISLERLDAAVSDLTTKLLQQFPECVRYTKQQVNFWKELSWHQTIGHAADWLAIHYSSMEPWEGMRAFVEKRPPGHMAMRERAATGGSSEFIWGPPALACDDCGARGIPASFAFCGVCGTALGAAGAENGGSGTGKAAAPRGAAPTEPVRAGGR